MIGGLIPNMNRLIVSFYNYLKGMWNMLPETVVLI